jgi:hypothetical protein
MQGDPHDGAERMAKNYTDELAGWVRQHAEKKRLQDSAAVAFVAVKADVTAAMDAGYALTTIWEHMHETGKLKCGYETFRKHVHRFIQSPAAELPATRAQIGAAKNDVTGGAAKQPKTPKKNETPRMSGFTFDPTPNKEDLL